MSQKVKIFLKPFLKKNLPHIQPGDIVRVHQRIREIVKKDKKSKPEKKERVQSFEGVVLAKKHGREIGSTITVRKIISGIGVERILPLHSPTIEKIEIISRAKVRRAKLYYLREKKGKKAKLKKKELKSLTPKKEKEESKKPISSNNQ